MFNRSKKYIFLLIVNVIILIAVALKVSQEPDDPFDTDYVIGILENEVQLKNAVIALENQLLSATRRESSLKNQIEQTQLLINTSEQKYRSCEIEKRGIIADAKQSNKSSVGLTDTNKQCSSALVDLSVAQNKIESLQAQASRLGNELTQSQEQLINANQLLAQAQNRDNTELQNLRLRVLELEQAIKEPISIEQNYINARYCTKPRFDSLICVQEFLVRPTFTKVPVNRLQIEVLDPNKEIVAQGEFNSAKSQLYRLTLGRGAELTSGMYQVVYRVDNQTLQSKLLELKQ